MWCIELYVKLQNIAKCTDIHVQVGQKIFFEDTFHRSYNNRNQTKVKYNLKIYI